MSDDVDTCPHCSADLVDVTIGEQPAAPNAKRPPAWLVFGGVAAAVLAVGLTAWAMFTPAGAGPEMLDRFPSDSLFFVEIDVADLMSDDSRALVEAFGPVVEAGTGEPFDLDTLIDDVMAEFDTRLGEFDFSFDEDIASWATGPVAFAALGGAEDIPDRFALLVGGDDASALDAFLAKTAALPGMEDLGTVEVGDATLHRMEFDDGTSGLIGRHGTELVVATDEEAATALVSPASGDTLADVSDVSTQVAELPGNAAAVFVVNGAEASAAFGQLGGMRGAGSGASLTGWTSGAVTTDRRGLRVDYVTALGETPAPSFSDGLTAAVPADTVAFLRLGTVIDQVETMLEVFPASDSLEEEIGVSLDEVLAVFSVDGGLAIWPSTDPELPVNGALVGVSDEPQGGFVDRLADLAGTMGVTLTPVDGGYSFDGLVTLGTRDTLTLLTTDRDLIAANPEEAFPDGALYGRATELVDGDIVLALDLPAVIDLVDGLVGTEDPEAAELLRCLPLGVAAGGVDVSGELMKTT
ncbi:MAG TPA: hypothetical protein VJ938_08105, partial [Acidimicrobiia bacterium]|nr:hypothetical protein [Acidimicrobiia bacterium]